MRFAARIELLDEAFHRPDDPVLKEFHRKQIQDNLRSTLTSVYPFGQLDMCTVEIVEVPADAED